MTDTIVDVSREGSTAILRIHGEITGGSEPPIMAAYAEAGDARSIVLDFGQLDFGSADANGFGRTRGQHEPVAFDRGPFGRQGIVAFVGNRHAGT